jgi:hypothetical protein
MRQIAEFVAVLACSFFTGAAVCVRLAEACYEAKKLYES